MIAVLDHGGLGLKRWLSVYHFAIRAIQSSAASGRFFAHGHFMWLQ